MGGKRKWQYKTAQADGWVDAGIGVFDVSGVMTPSASLEVIRDNADWTRATANVCQVVRYDCCAMAIDAESLLCNAQAIALTNRSLETPTALLVHADQHELFSTYADLMAEAGILRAVFLDLDSALAWAREMAPIYAELTGSVCPGRARSSAVSWHEPRASTDPLEEHRRVAQAARRRR